MYGVDASSPYLFELMEQTADHFHWDSGESWGDIRKGITDKTSAAGGGHAHIGLMIYQGDNWPAEYRGRIYTLNLHGRRINSDIPCAMQPAIRPSTAPTCARSPTPGSAAWN